jgi:hypothetical protein
LLSVHVIACLLLIVIILIQAGRGGGLVDSLSNVRVDAWHKDERSSYPRHFGAFHRLLCDLPELALLSARQSRSLMHDLNPLLARLPNPQP